MIDKISYRLFFSLLTGYTITFMLYLFAVINVLSHTSCVAILIFAFICIAMDYGVLICTYKFKRFLGTDLVTDILFFTLFYSLMHHFTVIYARNILLGWQYTLFQGFYLLLCILCVVPRVIYKMK